MNRPDAYVYLAAIYCPGCVIEAMIVQGDASPAARDMPPETVLDQCAYAMGIDRYDQATYDTDEFPKVAFFSDDDTCYHCRSAI